MKKLEGVLVAIAVTLATLRGQEPVSKPAESRPLTPAEEVAAIDKEFNDALAEVFKAFRNAKNDDEKKELIKKYPDASKRFPRLFAIAKADPKSPAAETALMWILEHDREQVATEQVLDALAKDHLESAAAGSVAQRVMGSISPKAVRFLEALEEKNPDRNVKALALYGQAVQKRSLGEVAESIQSEKDPKALAEVEHDWPAAELARIRAVDLAKTEKEAEAILLRVKEKYSDVDFGDGPLGELVDAELFEMRNLAIGKVAPEIEGEDIQGKPLKLSDFKGKVVVLDFWGNW